MMDKKFKDLKIGDYIWYYDHCKLHRQKITKAEIITNTEEISFSFGYNKKIYVTKEIYIEAGKGTKMFISSYYFDKDEYLWRGIPRFSNYTSAKRYVNRLIYYRKKE